MRRGLIGYPLGHSYSKIIHEYLTNKPYELIPLDEEAFHRFMRDKDFTGINVTIPYKQWVIPYLNEMDDQARRIGAVNCIVQQKGKLYGHNTDYDGFRWLLERNDITILNRTVAILGTGGAAKACRCVIDDMHPKAVYMVSRYDKPGTITYEQLRTEYRDIDVLINCTPVGMFPNNDETPVDVKDFVGLTAVVDVIYNPIRTRLVIEALDIGIKAVGGLEMLVGQAVKAIEYFSLDKVSEEQAEECLKMLEEQKKNIVLIGMPSCGKSSVGHPLSEKLGYELVEMDKKIEEAIEMPIRDYFAHYGEEAFRDKETELATSLRDQGHCVISCGGGIIKKPENMRVLRENGTVFFLVRDIDKLMPTDDRPLSSNLEDMKRLYDERLDLYYQYADVVVDNNGKLEDTIDMIMERVKG
ncbi:MAG: shikimate dehydrogenase [Erysipelotrichaceae bacterium]|nr:shikimate dehydrogenase [Erysipelotrichaceae bacterium]